MAIITLITSGVTNSISTSVKLADVVDEIKNEIKNVYSDISEAHFNSARQAFRAAASSSNPSDELRNAIAHLRDSYNIVEILINKKITTGFLFWTAEENLIDGYYERIRLYSGLCQLATLIAVSYNTLVEYSNATEWKGYALSYFDCSNLEELDDDGLNIVSELHFMPSRKVDDYLTILRTVFKNSTPRAARLYRILA